MRRHVLTLFGIFLLLAAAAAPVQPGETQRPAAPAITPDGGDYPQNAAIRISIRSDPGSVVIYTLDGSDPGWTNGIRSESNLVFFDLPPGDVIVKAAAHRPGQPLGLTRIAKFFRSGK